MVVLWGFGVTETAQTAEEIFPVDFREIKNGYGAGARTKNQVVDS